jgi:hypothetical protein
LVTNNLLWQVFSFNEIKAISSSSTTIYAASENALFSNALNNQINTTTTVDGLSGQTISALYYSLPLISLLLVETAYSL